MSTVLCDSARRERSVQLNSELAQVKPHYACQISASVPRQIGKMSPLSLLHKSDNPLLVDRRPSAVNDSVEYLNSHKLSHCVAINAVIVHVAALERIIHLGAR